MMKLNRKNKTATAYEHSAICQVERSRGPDLDC